MTYSSVTANKQTRRSLRIDNELCESQTQTQCKYRRDGGDKMFGPVK